MLSKKFSFNLLKESGQARFGKIKTHRGEIDTPTFMTVGTQGTVKAAFIDDVILSGAQIILASMHQIGSIILVTTSLILVFKNSKIS